MQKKHRDWRLGVEHFSATAKVRGLRALGLHAQNEKHRRHQRRVALRHQTFTCSQVAFRAWRKGVAIIKHEHQIKRKAMRLMRHRVQRKAWHRWVFVCQQAKQRRCGDYRVLEAAWVVTSDALMVRRCRIDEARADRHFLERVWRDWRRRIALTRTRLDKVRGAHHNVH